MKVRPCIHNMYMDDVECTFTQVYESWCTLLGETLISV